MDSPCDVMRHVLAACADGLTHGRAHGGEGVGVADARGWQARRELIGLPETTSCVVS